MVLRGERRGLKTLCARPGYLGTHSLKNFDVFPLLLLLRLVCVVVDIVVAAAWLHVRAYGKNTSYLVSALSLSISRFDRTV